MKIFELTKFIFKGLINFIIGSFIVIVAGVFVLTLEIIDYSILYFNKRFKKRKE